VRRKKEKFISLKRNEQEHENRKGTQAERQGKKVRERDRKNRKKKEIDRKRQCKMGRARQEKKENDDINTITRQRNTGKDRTGYDNRTM
jgi:hypothetical protein